MVYAWNAGTRTARVSKHHRRRSLIGADIHGGPESELGHLIEAEEKTEGRMDNPQGGVSMASPMANTALN